MIRKHKKFYIILGIGSVIAISVVVAFVWMTEQQHSAPFVYALFDDEGTEQSSQYRQSQDDNAPQENPRSSLEQRKIIKEGELAFECSNLLQMKATIEHATTAYNGYISLEDERRYPHRIEQHLVIRIPAESFDAFIAEISRGIPKFDRRHVKVIDVTEEYRDIETRLTIKKETEQRYRNLLAQASTVKDILLIEEQIGTLRADIESVETRLQSLQSRIAYSTLTITFYEAISTPKALSSQFKKSAITGWENFLWFCASVLTIWPFLLIFAILGVIWIVQRKSHGRRY